MMSVDCICPTGHLCEGSVSGALLRPLPCRVSQGLLHGVYDPTPSHTISLAKLVLHNKSVTAVVHLKDYNWMCCI